MRTYKIYLIRHGKTAGNKEGRFVGSTDVSICEEGVAELVTLTNEYDYPNVGAVYTSPMLRAVQTAKVIYPHHEPVAVTRLREYCFGAFEGKKLEELKNDPNFLDFVSEEKKFLPEGAEPIDEFHSRVVEGLEFVIRDMMSRKISDAAIITHGGVIMQLLSACGLPTKKPTEWMTDNGHGFTLLVNASLWGNTKKAEIFSPLPYDKIPE